MMQYMDGRANSLYTSTYKDIGVAVSEKSIVVYVEHTIV
jgi:hypothetical protein